MSNPMEYGGAPLDMVFNGINSQQAFGDTRPSLSTKSTSQTGGGTCCGANFWGNQQDHVNINGKNVDFNQVRGILKRNQALTHVGQKPRTPIWIELGLSKTEYQHALKLYRQLH